jgi:hypothetical protein
MNNHDKSLKERIAKLRAKNQRLRADLLAMKQQNEKVTAQMKEKQARVLTKKRRSR